MHAYYAVLVGREFIIDNMEENKEKVKMKSWLPFVHSACQYLRSPFIQIFRSSRVGKSENLFKVVKIGFVSE